LYIDVSKIYNPDIVYYELLTTLKTGGFIMANYIKLKQPLPVRTEDGTIVRVYGVCLKGKSKEGNPNDNDYEDCWDTGIPCDLPPLPPPLHYVTVCLERENGNGKTWHFCLEKD